MELRNWRCFSFVQYPLGFTDLFEPISPLKLRGSFFSGHRKEQPPVMPETSKWLRGFENLRVRSEVLPFKGFNLLKWREPAMVAVVFVAGDYVIG